MPEWFWIIFGIIMGLLAFAVIVVILQFLIVFYVPNRTKKWLEECTTPPGKAYDKYRKQMIDSIKEVRAMEHTNFELRSFDGLLLKGKYYECKKGAPIELLLHGYRGCGESDLSVGVKRAFKLGHNAFLIDHRAAGFSEGNIISFGVNETKDCLAWINLIIKTFGAEQKIILTGISMGAATALLTAGQNPPNVIGVIADCGYSSAEEIIKKVIKQLHLPVKPIYPIIKFAGKLFGGFNLDEANVTEAVRNCKVPIAFFHGETDGFVPAEMTKKNFDACNAKKQLLLVPNCDHGLCYIIDDVGYLKTLDKFLIDCGLKK